MNGSCGLRARHRRTEQAQRHRVERRVRERRREAQRAELGGALHLAQRAIHALATGLHRLDEQRGDLALQLVERGARVRVLPSERVVSAEDGESQGPLLRSRGGPWLLCGARCVTTREYVQNEYTPSLRELPTRFVAFRWRSLG